MKGIENLISWLVKVYSNRTNFKEGWRDGLLERYYENGQLESKDCYKNSEITDMSYCEK